MATYSWIGVNGDWSDAADWTGGPPSPPPDDTSAIADIGGAGSSAVTISTGQQFTVQSANVTDASATLALSGTAALDVTALTTVSGATVSIGNGAQLALDETGVFPPSPTTLTNSGTIALGSTGSATLLTMSQDGNATLTGGGTVSL